MTSTPLNHSHIIRTRNDPLGRRAQDAPRPSKLTKFEIMDGQIRGWAHKPLYAQSVVPEFPRSPDPRIRRPKDPRPPPFQLSDLECIRSLGRGEYGQVLLVRNSRNAHPTDKPGSLFSMKVLRKKVIRLQDETDPPKKDIERSILCELPWHPYVNGVIQAFHDSRNLYLMLEFVPCGSLRALIQKRAPFDSATTVFYFANIVCGLMFLERCEVLHRDLKPENILVDSSGYLCLADFGSAAKVEEGYDRVFVGTPTYMAPEMFSPEDQSDHTCTGGDWWSSGCILYEMITGKMPFYGRDMASTFKKSSSGIYEWPPTIRVGKILKSLVAELLTVDAPKRLGTFGCSQVLQHPWLKGVDWGKIELRQYLAPYVPPSFSAETWHRHPLPEQSKIPGLRVIAPPVHLAHDDRFPEKQTI